MGHNFTFITRWIIARVETSSPQSCDKLPEKRFPKPDIQQNLSNLQSGSSRAAVTALKLQMSRICRGLSRAGTNWTALNNNKLALPWNQ